MKTVAEMYDYCSKKKLIGGTKKRMKKNLQVIEDNLMKGERVKVVLGGIADYQSITDNEGVYAFAITDQRIMKGRKEPLFGTKFSSVNLKYLNDIHFETVTGNGLLDNGIITFDTMKEAFSVCSGRKQMQKVFNEIQQIVYDKDTQ